MHYLKEWIKVFWITFSNWK